MFMNKNHPRRFWPGRFLFVGENLQVRGEDEKNDCCNKNDPANNP
jgi:hypothetical protein